MSDHSSAAGGEIRRIGIMTGGGDCPGLNAVIRAVVLKAHGLGWEVMGIEDATEGLVDLAYGNLGRYLQRSHHVVEYPYDWRQPLEASEDRLEAFIDEVQNRTALMRHYAGSPWKKTRKVNLVGHSMGGLMIAGLLARKPDVAKRIGKVATIGTPYQGSVEAIAKICMGTSTLGADGSSSREREAARMTPSLYYLLPSFKGAVEKDAVNLFDAGSWQLGVLETLKRYLNTYSVKFEGNASIVQARALLTEMLEPAEAHRKRIEAVGGVPGDLGADNWLAIAGIGAETRTSVGAGKTPEGNPFFVRTYLQSLHERGALGGSLYDDMISSTSQYDLLAPLART